MFNIEVDNAFNRYTNLDNVEGKIVLHLINSTSKHAENIWKLLKYNDPRALLYPNLTRKEKIDLVYNGTQKPEKTKIFLQPFIDDAWQEQGSRLDVFVSGTVPENHIVSNINITFETIVHNNINALLGDADEENPLTNPSELSADGEVLVTQKSRATVLLKSILAEFNGTNIGGLGVLQHNRAKNLLCSSRMQVWNNRAYFGHSITFTTMMGNVSTSPNEGY